MVALLSRRRRSAERLGANEDIIYISTLGQAVVAHCFSSVMNQHLCTLVVFRELLTYSL